MNDVIVTWKNEIVAELAEARDALAEATTAAQQAIARHQAALATTAAVKASLARLPELATTLALPITGRVAAAAAEVETAAQAARRALLEQKEAEARVERLTTAAEQLNAVLAAAAEPEEVTA